MASIDVNVILVGGEYFTVDARKKVRGALDVLRETFDQVDVSVGNVEWYAIATADAAGYVVIESNSEARTLTASWTVRNNGLDLFVVPFMVGASGWSAVDGPCDKNAAGWMTGSVASNEGAVPYVGNSVAHEIGHYLGLEHIPDSGNFIGGYGNSNSWTGIHDWQGDIMKRHCFVRS